MKKTSSSSNVNSAVNSAERTAVSDEVAKLCSELIDARNTFLKLEEAFYDANENLRNTRWKESDGDATHEDVIDAENQMDFALNEMYKAKARLKSALDEYREGTNHLYAMRSTEQGDLIREAVSSLAHYHSEVVSLMVKNLKKSK
jgi:hypothetical protein